MGSDGAHPRTPMLTPRQIRTPEGDVMLDGRTLWELVDAQGRGHSRRADGGRRERAHDDVRRVRVRGGAGRGRARQPRDRRRRPWSPGSCRPGSSRWCSSAALSRLGRGAEPVAADLPRARGRLHHQPGALAAADRPRHRGTASTSRRWPPGSPRRATACGCWSRTGRCPRVICRSCRPRRPRSTPTTSRCGGSSTRRARPPIRRAPATPTRRSRRWHAA